MTHSDTQWHLVIPSDTQWYSTILCGNPVRHCLCNKIRQSEWVVNDNYKYIDMAFPLVCCSGGVSFVWHPLSTLLIMSRPDEEALDGNIRSDDQNRTMVCLFNSYHLGHTRPGNIIFSVSLFGKYHDIVSQTLWISDQTTRTEMLCLFNSYRLGHTRPQNIVFHVLAIF